MKKLCLSTRFLCLLMAFSVLIVSCDTKNMGVIPSPINDIENNQILFKSGSDVLIPKLDELINQVYDMEALSQYDSRDEVIKHINTVFSNYGVENAVDFEAIDEILSQFFYLNTGNDFSPFFII